ncbi:Subtilisin-like protease 2 [Golovinomyces cichoracearum]|uniref:Subtilisin-like protease 2 n=1 Tax=Golovinomyces cichoracearum TaxID=62708 RepID=A0A420I9Y3_9PEZI|nr:Subtilisin-like protease 2 [Golovinomyces cichoracearum]
MLALKFHQNFLVVYLLLLSSAQSKPLLSSREAKPELLVKGLGLPVSNLDIDPDHTIPSRYIVVYDKNATDDAVDLHQASVLNEVKKRSLTKRNSDGKPLSPMVHSMNLKGWRAICLEAEDSMIINIGGAAEVAYIEADVKMGIQDTIVQENAPVGLSRLSHASTSPDLDYRFDDDADGEGVVVYVLDTGVRITHEVRENINFIPNYAPANTSENLKDLGNRGEMAANFVDDVETDQNGHGSHVAGIIAGEKYGVAKKASIVAVKVLDEKGQGSNAMVLQGIQYVAADVMKRGIAGKAVVNVSIGGPKSEALNAAIEAITKDGVVVVVAAGNSNKDAKTFSPASAPSAITVGAIDARNDTRARFSNFGEKVDIFAPGVKVESIGIKNDHDTKVMSGTSMASPHVAGLAACLISAEPELDDPYKVINRILSLARSTHSGVIQPNDGTVELIAYNGGGDD